MNKFINYYGQELQVGDYLYNIHGYGVVQIEHIVAPDIAQNNTNGSFRIWFWSGFIDKDDDGSLHKHIRGTQGNDNKGLYKIEPNEEIERMFSIHPTMYGESKEFDDLKVKYEKIYNNKIIEKNNTPQNIFNL